MMINEEKLVCYVDGELEASEYLEVEQLAASDAALKARLEHHQRLRPTLRSYYDPILEEEVPVALSGTISDSLSEKVVNLDEARTRRQRPVWQNFSAIAATLVGGILLGHLLPLGDGASPRADRPYSPIAEARLDAALETQLASAQSANDSVQVGVSFVGPGEKVCRTFEASAAAGLACRGDAGWDVLLLAPTAPGGSSEYRQANSGAALLMSTAQDMMVGEPFDSETERRARDSGWKSSSSD